MPSNNAAYIDSPKASSLVIRPAPYPVPSAKDVLVQAKALAINPLEFRIQDDNPPIGGNALSYPTILGADVCGIIVATGADVVDLKVGQKVMANAPGVPNRNPAMSAFQEFVLLPENCVTCVPEKMAFDEAVVLPLGCDTAMAGLFVADRLALSVAGLEGHVTGGMAEEGAVLIWGGSSSVGCCGIQLARAAGYEVWTTASRRNHNLCLELGAEKVFDYTEEDVEGKIVEALKGKTVVGALDCVSEERTITSCADILAKVGGSKVVTVLTPPQIELAQGVEAQRLSIPALHTSEVYHVVHRWMATALEEGSLKPKPDAFIVGDGLESVQKGIDLVRKGVSATKVVVKL